MHRDPHQCERTIQFSRTERKSPSDWGAKNLEDDLPAVKQNSNIFQLSVGGSIEGSPPRDCHSVGAAGGAQSRTPRAPFERQIAHKKGLSARSCPQPFHATDPAGKALGRDDQRPWSG
jgi:hypothetical protein